jgi:indolepyruvate ferredoxin oxidoreductase
MTVMIIGDDPWSDSTQVPADSRYLCKHLFLPVMEPSTNQEIKDWIALAFQISRASGFYIGYLVTTNQADGGGVVNVRPNYYPAVNTQQLLTIDTAKIPFEETVLLPPRTANKEDKIVERQEKLWHVCRELGLNQILPGKAAADARCEIGFVASGMGFCYLQHALDDMGVTDQFPILKLGITYPIDPEIVSDFCAQVKNIVVVEERRGFMEEQIADIVRRFNQLDAGEGGRAPLLTNVWGKEFPHGLRGIPQTRGLNVSVLIERLSPLLKSVPTPASSAARIEQELALLDANGKFDVRIPGRTPTFCPGCPHRDSASVLMEIKKQFRDAAYMQQRHGRKPLDLVFHGDTGCYTMLMFEPTKELMHNYSGMGLGGGTGAGIDPFITNKQITFLGDSTFFHSGIAAISNSLKQQQDIVYVILDNKTTAMTGHQPVPSQAPDLMGDETYKQNIDRICEALLGNGVEVVRANPELRDHWKHVLEETILRDGVKVVVADKECGITYHRRGSRAERATLRKQGYLAKKKYINVTQEVCENCLECTKGTGCPGLTFVDTPLGSKVQTDLSWCVADGACHRIKACPSFEEVTVLRKQAPPSPLEGIDLTNLPLPEPRRFDGSYRIYLAGVGGMGIGVSTATLVRAGFKQGYEVQFCDKKGLAIRNGGVYSQIVFSRDGSDHTCNIIPYGKADLLIGIDLLEAVRSLSPNTNLRVGSPQRTTAVVNTFKTPTILTLLGVDDFKISDLEETMRRYTRHDQYFGLEFSTVCEHYFGTKLYTNVLMLGVAFQRGLLPIDLTNIEWALKETMGPDAQNNLNAFALGRRLVVNPELISRHHLTETYEQFIAERLECIRRDHRAGRKLAETFVACVKRAEKLLGLGEQTCKDIVYRLYDLIEYDKGRSANRYLDLVEHVFASDSAGYEYAATKAAVCNLHRVMIIKDEVFVAHLLTSYEKLRRDYHRYHIDPERGDKLIYRHINRPRFDIGPLHFEWDMRTRNWMLNLMKHMRWLRAVLPAWHRREKQHREWYIGLVRDFRYHDRASYETWVKVLRTPEQATGFREVRYPKMDAAEKEAAELLQHLQRGPKPSAPLYQFAK